MCQGKFKPTFLFMLWWALSVFVTCSLVISVRFLSLCTDNKTGASVIQPTVGIKKTQAPYLGYVQGNPPPFHECDYWRPTHSPTTQRTTDIWTKPTAHEHLNMLACVLKSWAIEWDFETSRRRLMCSKLIKGRLYDLLTQQKQKH